MKTLRLLFVAFLLCLMNPYLAFNQDNDKKAGQQSAEQKCDCPESQKKAPEVLQFFNLSEKKHYEAIERAVLEIEFNQMVDEIDFLYHIPPQFQQLPEQYSGLHHKMNKQKKGEQ